MENKLMECKLDGASIDKIAETISKELLDKKKNNRKDVLRLRLSTEEVLGYWAKTLGENSNCECLSGRCFGKTYLELKIKGIKSDPRENDELNLGINNSPNILSAMGMVVNYEYKDGYNILRVSQPASQISKIMPTVLCFCCPLIFGFGMRKFSPEIADGLYTYLVDPIFAKVMELLGLIAGPLIFLSLYSGILGIGDKNTFDVIGKKAFIRFVSRIFFILLFTILLLIPFFGISLNSVGGLASGLSSALVLILDIIPSNIVSPFLEGNAMQIVFLALAMGIVSLSLGDLVAPLSSMVQQLNLIVEQMMSAISKIMSGFMVVSLLDLSLSGSSVDLSSLLKFVIMIVLVCIVYLLFYALLLMIRYKLKPLIFIKAVISSAIMAFVTASLPAVLGINLDTCHKNLKISNRFVNFAVPFGQILYKPATGLSYILTALCLAEYTKVEITPIFLLTLLILSTVLAVATPPIPGGAIGSLTILFTQLGIPSSATALAINLTLLMDNTCALTNDVCFIGETYGLAKDLKMVD